MAKKRYEDLRSARWFRPDDLRSMGHRSRAMQMGLGEEDWDGKPVIDGAMADQAPMPDPDDGRTLVLLTRDYGSVPDLSDRTYLWPSREVPADKIDFTDPADIRRSWEIGEADGRRFLETFKTETNQTEE